MTPMNIFSSYSFEKHQCLSVHINDWPFWINDCTKVQLIVHLTWKCSLWFAVLKRIAVRKPFISCSNGMGSRLNGLSYPFKNKYEPFERLELSVQKKLGVVRMAGAIHSKKIGSCFEWLELSVQKNWEPFEWLELYLSKKLWAVRTGCSWRMAGDMFWNRSLQFLWKGCFEPWSCQS